MHDVILITGDADVDHPSFPAALLVRVLEAAGFTARVVSRPDPTAPGELAAVGAPRLFVGVTAGALDSMVANYTPLRKPRTDDPYSPGGRGPGRPDRAVTAYCNLARRAFGRQVLLVAGGVEAALRRFSHYDYWSDSVRRPILMDCGADLLVHGMGEGPVVEMARRLRTLVGEGVASRDAAVSLHDVRGVVYRTRASAPAPAGAQALPSHEEVVAAPAAFARAHRITEERADETLVQQCSGMRVVANPPWPPLTPAELDRIYALAFTRDAAAVYGRQRIPALEQVRFSVTSHRGCGGGCAFCAIAALQGRRVVSRSEQGILEEVRRIAAHRDFRGTVPDIGGATANMYGFACTAHGSCRRPSCLWPSRCAHLEGDCGRYAELLESAARVPGVRHLFVTTGVRMDLALQAPAFIRRLAAHHTSGHLKVAPEHVSRRVLDPMRKPAGASFERFLDAFAAAVRGSTRQQFVLPYLMAAHPGCTLDDMVDLALFLAARRIRAEQCQIFTPTPGTASSVMYATGLDPWTLAPLFVERSDRGKRLQKALILYHLVDNRQDVQAALRAAGRPDAAAALLSPQARKRDS